MGLPLYQAKSEHKKKSKTKPKPRTSLNMAPTSNSSSQEPHSGSPSSQSNNGHASRRHRDSSHRDRSTHSHRASHPTPARGPNNVNGVQDHSPPQVYEPPYNSAHTYSMHPPEQPVPVPREASYRGDQLSYPSPQFPIYASAQYDHELRLDEERAPAAPVDNQQYSSYPNGNQYSQIPAQGYYGPQAPAQQYPVQQNVSTSSTAADWSVQQLADERIRLGLTRYATEAEVEAARRAYDEASRRAPQ